VLVIGVALVTAGCGRQADDKKPAAKNKTEDKKDDKHGWWCEEHGVPEDICSLCSGPERVKQFKAKGDWCDLHNRAKSQCFKCDPKKYEKFAAMYRDKFNGETPTRPPKEEFEN
jgi:hypothetical protein